MDMVAYDGKVCRNCFLDKKCKDHPLGKRPDHLKEKDIYDLFHKRKKGKFEK